MSERGKANGTWRQRNRALLWRLGVVTVFMFGFGFALVPFYDQICRATGLQELGGLDGERDAAKNSQVDTTRKVRVEFDSNLRGLAWTFKPETPIVEVHPGALTQVLFDVTNTTDRPITGQAIPSYSPSNAVRYFHKLECFCFTRQTLGPGESRVMPVVFVLDPTMPKDMPTVSLSYTFFAVEGAN
ncbi:MAG TPA: cytochrome c oxidase assembly protein [Casimicrobiaceae bacterium]|jgi:cytochrome c oxidase assembly protein subunit 11|nr:cytochrome c oxidase assembly protein [Casimicrobiaceae bacterium]